MSGNAQRAKLAFVSHRFTRNDGQGRVNYEVVKAALDQGYAVIVLAQSCAEDISSHPACQFVKIKSAALPTELLRNIVFASSTARWLRKHRGQYDLVQANGFVTWEPCDVVAAHFVHAAWAKSSWYPFKSLAPYSLYQRLYTTLNVRWEKQAFLRARRVIAVAHTLVGELVGIGIPEARIDVVWNGVSTEEFEPGDPKRSSFDLPEGIPLALFVGDIRTPRKNLETVLRALKIVPELSLVVAGATEGSPYLALARELEVDQRVYFVGKTTEVPLLMRSVDMFVFPSRYEAHPLVLLEAMASGLPSIVSGTFGADAFLGGGGLILSNPNDVDELANYMRTLTNDRALRTELSAASRQQALRMQWQVSTTQYLSIFERMLQQQMPN